MRLTEFFEKCQEDGKKVETVVKKMLPLLKTMKPKEIVTELLWHVRQVFNTDERITAVNAVDKIIDFITTVVVTAGDIEKRAASRKNKAPSAEAEEEACNETFERFAFHLLKFKFLLCDNAYVRRLCCQLFARLMAGLPSDTDVSEELFTELSEAICDRMSDRSPAVRQAAARAAWRLQDPYAEDCPVATALAVMAANDHHMGCRLAAVETIHIPTLIGTPAVIGRFADTCEAVRRAAMKRLCNRQDGSVISVRVLTPEHVRTVLARVVCEPSAKLRQSYGQQLLVRRWLDEDCRGDICSFLALINVDTCRDLGRRTLQFFLSSEPDRLEKVVNSFTVPAFSSNGTTNTSLTIERVFSWNLLIDTVLAVKKRDVQGADELFSKLLPKCDEIGENNNQEIAYYYNKTFVDYFFTFLTDLFDSPPSDDVELHSAIFIGEHLLSVLRNYCRVLETPDLERVVGHLAETLSRDTIHPRFVDLLTKTFCELLGNGVPAVTRVAALVSELLDPEHGSPVKKAQPCEEDKKKQQAPTKWEDPEKTREIELHVASLRVRLNEMRDELDELLQMQRYEDAALCRERIDAVKEELAEAMASKLNALNPKNDNTTPVQDEDDLSLGTQQLAKQRLSVVQNRPNIAIRLLSVLGACLEQCRPSLPVSSGLITELRSVFDDFVVSSIATPHPVVRAAALRVLGHCCFIDRELAATLHGTFLVQLQLDVQVSETTSTDNFGEITDGPIAAMHVLTDIAVRHGFEVFTNDCEIANAIAHKLQSGDAAVQRAAGESLAQLLLSGRCPRKQVPGLMSRLVHFWFDADLAAGRDLDPHSELLRASLAAFFRMYPTQSAGSLAAFAESFFPTLRLVDDENVFSKVKPHAVAMFFGQKISPATNPDLPVDVHSQAAVIQQSVALFLLNSMLASVKKMKQREAEEISAEEEQQQPPDDQQKEDGSSAESNNNEDEDEPLKKIADKLKETPKDAALLKEHLWYRVVTVATAAFVTTVQISQNAKHASRLADLHSLTLKLLDERFESKLPMALVKRRCRKDLENFAKNLATALNIEPPQAAIPSIPPAEKEIITDNTASFMSPLRPEIVV